MPDDERLDGTRDPNSRRHRRDGEQPPQEEQPRRRRRSVESGGVSVADLVQRHTGSRPDLTPVNPEQVRSNSVMTGRRALQEGGPPQNRQNAAPPPPPPPPPPAPPIAAALDGTDAYPQDRPSHRARPADPAPREEPRRPGGTSSYFTIPSDAIRDSVSSGPGEPPAPSGEFPTFPPEPLDGYPLDDAPRRPRRPGEGSGPRNTFPRDEAAFQADNGRFPGQAGRRPAPGNRRPSPFASEDPRRGDGFAPDGFPPDPDAPRRGGPRRVGEASAHHPMPNGFAPDEPGSHRRAGDYPGPGADQDGPRRNGRRGVGEASGPRPGDGFAPDPGGSRRNGRRAGGAPMGDGFAPDHDSRRNGAHGLADASAHPGDGFPPDHDPRRNGAHGLADASAHPGDGFAPDHDGPRRNGRRRIGEASGLRPAPEGPHSGFAPEQDMPRRNGGRRIGEASTHLPIPGEAPDGPHGGFGPDPDASRRNGAQGLGDASAHPGEGFPPDHDGRRAGGRRIGEASTHLPIPGEAPEGFPTDEAPRPNGRRGRRGGEGARPVPGGFPPDGELPARRPGENSARFRPIPGEEPRPRPRPVGEASAHFNAPGFPEPGRPQGAVRRRAARASGPGPQGEIDPGLLFPSDAPPAPGQSSGLFPVDDGRRQEPPGPPDAIDAPGQKSRRISGVPPVPPPPPPMGDDDLVSMTTEMEAIGEEVQQRRKIDHTLARFSAVHDEIKAEEREKKAKRRKLRPWERGDDEMDRLDELDAQQSMAMAIPNLEPREEDDDPATAKKKRRWRKGKNAGKAFAIIFAALVFVSSAVAWGFKSYIEASAQTVDALDPDSDAIKDAAAQNGDENFLLVGSDTRAGAAAEDGVGNEDQVVGARSDTVMIAHIPKNRERVVVVSFPRDLEVTRPACEGWDPKTGNYTGVQNPEAKRVKLNTAYQVGGPKCVTKMVQELSGLAVNHFVGIDFNGFKDMVEAVQGVEVCVERPLEDETLGMVVPEAGKNVKLTGDQALNFVRARKVKGDPTSDYGRIIRQQRFLSSLLRKAMSTEVLLNPGKLTDFVDAFSKATFGDNIGIEQLFTLGESMQGVNAGKVTFITVPTVGEANKRGNEDLRTEASNALFEAIRQDVPLPGETTTQDDASTSTQAQQQSGLMAQQQQPSGTVDPKTIKLQVLNGGNKTGDIADDTADELAEFGFQVVRVDKTDPVDKTIIKYSKSREAQAQTIKAAVPGATLVEDASMSGAILLILGPEFDGTVQSPTGGGKTPEVPDGLSTVNAGDVSCA